MKELELTLSVRNNRLKERRQTLGMTQRQFAIAAKICLTTYVGLETMRLKPRTLDGEWNVNANKLAKFHCAQPEELFPSAVLKIDKPVAISRVDGIDVSRLIEGLRPSSQSPHELCEAAELNSRIGEVMDSLTPRENNILRLRFGFDDGRERTNREIAEGLGVSSGWVHAIGNRALRKLRHPKRTARLPLP